MIHYNATHIIMVSLHLIAMRPVKKHKNGFLASRVIENSAHLVLPKLYSKFPKFIVK